MCDGILLGLSLGRLLEVKDGIMLGLSLGKLEGNVLGFVLRKILGA